MSSILDALKKADRETDTEPGRRMSWSTAMSSQASTRRNRKRWRGLLVLGVGLVLGGLLIWYTQRSGPPPHKAATLKTETAPGNSRHAGAPAVAPLPDPERVSSALPRKPATPTSRKPPEPDVPSANAQRDPSIDETTAARFPKPSTAANKSTPASTAAPPEASSTAQKQGSGESGNPPADAARKSKAIQQEQPPVEDGKTYKRDPRIALQALVWAEQPEARFAVINNQLVREGDTIEDIVVEKINPEDVRLVEGDNRWHQKFQVR